MCAEKNRSSDIIIIYGSDTCQNCQSLMKSLDSSSIKYIFYDVDKDLEKNIEMWNKVSSVNKSKYNIILPVVDVNGKILITNPTSFKEIKKYLIKPKVIKKK